MIFKQIKEKLESKATSIYTDKQKGTPFVFLEDAIKAIECIQKTLHEGHFGCNSNGEHERCDGCGLYSTCPDYNKHWFQRAFPPKEVSALDDHWIPCKYHQPKVYDEYLVTCEGISVPQIRMFEGDWDSTDRVIAWQPLPKTYKEDMTEGHDCLSEFQEQVNYLKKHSTCSDAQIGCFLCNYDDSKICGRFKSSGCLMLSGCEALYTIQCNMNKE